MDDSKPKVNRGWTAPEREYCIRKYYSSGEQMYHAQCCFWWKFGSKIDKFPSDDHMKAFLLGKKYEKKLSVAVSLKQTEELKKSETSNLSGTKWGRKTGENRIVRTESVDLGEQYQAIQWKERNTTKWSGPRSVNEKLNIDVPMIAGRPYWWYYYNEKVEKEEEEVKRDKKQVQAQELKEKFEGEILELINSLDAPGHAARTSAFVSFRAALQRRAVDGLLGAHRATLADHVARALRRGKNGERKAAAAIAPLLALQIGEDDIKQFVREVRPALSATATDRSASLDARIQCCSSLAVLCYLVDDDLTETLNVMRMYETIFRGSYPKNYGSVKAQNAAVEEGLWHAAALDGWALLLPLLSPNHALSLLNNHAPSFAQLGELLEATSVEVRMAAGSALAIAYETVTNDNSDNPLAAHVDVLLPRLIELARVSHKSLAKNASKKQRATFRDVLKYFEEGSAPCGSAQTGTETAAWRGWWRGAAHAALAAALAGALPVLAPHSPRLRALLQLPAERPQEKASQEKPKKQNQEKSKKLQRHLQHRAASKARSYSLNKNRDKRSAMLPT